MHKTLRCTLRYAYSTSVGPPPKYPIFIQKTTVIGGFLVGIAYTILKYPEGQGEIKLNLALLQFYNSCWNSSTKNPHKGVLCKFDYVSKVTTFLATLLTYTPSV